MKYKKIMLTLGLALMLMPSFLSIVQAGSSALLQLVILDAPAQHTPSTASSIPSSARIFVTSATYNGSFNAQTASTSLPDQFQGRARADELCQEQANRANLGGWWKAMLSDEDHDLHDTVLNVAYQRLACTTSDTSCLAEAADDNGLSLASNFLDLFDGSLTHTIRTTELSTHFNHNHSGKPWTGSNASGGKKVDMTCNNWKSSSESLSGAVGNSASKEGDWLDNGAAACSTFHPLFCFEYFAPHDYATQPTLEAHTPKSFAFQKTSIVYQVDLQANRNLSDQTLIQIDDMLSRPKKLPTPNTGTPVYYGEITTSAGNQNLDQGKIYFNLPPGVIAAANQDVVLNHFNVATAQWDSLSTQKAGNHYEAITPGFSYFSIVLVQKILPPAPPPPAPIPPVLSGGGGGSGLLTVQRAPQIPIVEKKIKVTRGAAKKLTLAEKRKIQREKALAQKKKIMKKRKQVVNKPGETQPTPKEAPVIIGPLKKITAQKLPKKMVSTIQKLDAIKKQTVKKISAKAKTIPKKTQTLLNNKTLPAPVSEDSGWLNITRVHAKDPVVISGKEKVGSKKMITVDVHSPEIFFGTVETDENGDWSWALPADLTTGFHSITVKKIDPEDETSFDSSSYPLLVESGANETGDELPALEIPGAASPEEHSDESKRLYLISETPTLQIKAGQETALPFSLDAQGWNDKESFDLDVEIQNEQGDSIADSSQSFQLAEASLVEVPIHVDPSTDPGNYTVLARLSKDSMSAFAQSDLIVEDNFSLPLKLVLGGIFLILGFLLIKKRAGNEVRKVV